MNKEKNRSFIGFIWPYIAVLIIIGAAIFFYSGNTSKYRQEFTNFNDLKSALTANDVTVNKFEITEKETIIDVTGVYTARDVNNAAKMATYQFTIRLPIVNEGEDHNVVTKAEFYEFAYSLKDAKGVSIVKINYAFQTSIWTTLLIYGLPTILAVVFIFILFNRIGGKGDPSNKAFEFGKSPMRHMSNPNKKFKDVAGCDEEKAEMAELVDYLKNPKKFTDMGARVPKGVLLTGQPGTGKTLLAKAVAGEAGVPFFFISGSDFVEMFVGVGASRVRDMFAQAKRNKPCIIFIDEIDAVGRQRGTGLGGGHDEREQTLNQLLVEMDGFEENSGIILIAATNRPDVLDPALLRPGRFDRQITVDLPDKNGREGILSVHKIGKKFDESVDFSNIAKRTPGFSGADLENVLNEAAILAVRQNKDSISMADIDEAIDRVMGGPAKKSRKFNEKEKRIVAYHEAGHTIVGLKLNGALKVQKVTIIPRGEANGYVLMMPEDDKFVETKSELLERITGLLGGRCSEEIFFNDVTSGAQNDIEKATKIARLMVTNFGMSDLGPIQFEQPQGSVFLGRDYTNASRNISGEVAYAIDQEIKKIMDTCMANCKKIINDNKDELIKVAEALIEHETLSYEEINEILNPKPVEEVKVEEPKVESEENNG